MVAVTLDSSAPLRSFRISTPVVRTSSADFTAIAVLSMAALIVWMLVLPLEIVFLAA